MSDSRGYFTGTRLKMVDDLLSRYDFHGWDVEEIQDFLGEPDDSQENIIRYDLRDGLNWLIFEFNDDFQIVDYHVYRP